MVTGRLHEILRERNAGTKRLNKRKSPQHTDAHKLFDTLASLINHLAFQ